MLATTDANASTTNTIAGSSATDNGGYQTVAIVPDGSGGGGFVLIVQPQTGQVGLPVSQGAASLAIAPNEQVDQASDKESHVQTLPNPPTIRVKKEKDAEKPNDISVYDFDDGKALKL